MPIEIVKVQRPIMAKDSNQPWLVYDKARSHVETKPSKAIGSDLRKAMGDDHKAYFHGAWSSTGGWELSERVEDQSW